MKDDIVHLNRSTHEYKSQVAARICSYEEQAWRRARDVVHAT
jgi:hypothetical protein